MKEETVNVGMRLRQVAPCVAVVAVPYLTSAWCLSPEYFYIECEL